jgi:hypothetical protein
VKSSTSAPWFCITHGRSEALSGGIWLMSDAFSGHHESATSQRFSFNQAMSEP